MCLRLPCPEDTEMNETESALMVLTVRIRKQALRDNPALNLNLKSDLQKFLLITPAHNNLSHALLWAVTQNLEMQGRLGGSVG